MEYALTPRREPATNTVPCILCAENGVVTRESLPDTIRFYCEARSNPAGHDAVAFDDSKKGIETAVHKAKGNETLAAHRLGIDRTTLWRRMQRLGLG